MVVHFAAGRLYVVPPNVAQAVFEYVLDSYSNSSSIQHAHVPPAPLRVLDVCFKIKTYALTEKMISEWIYLVH